MYSDTNKFSYYKLIKIDNLDAFLTETGGSEQEYLLNIITNVMYLVLPGLWVALLGWAGVKAGAGIDGAISSSGKESRQTTQKGQETTTKKAGI